MDTRVIDVVIGLVLVFALTSLLVTALQEVVSMTLRLRGRNLWRAVVSFVGDDRGFAERLTRHPLLVSLAQGTREEQRRPSYIPTGVMISALLAHLVEHHARGVRPQTPAELAAMVQADSRAGHPEAPNVEFARALGSLVHGVEQDWAAYEARLAAWFDAVGERSAGWFRRQAQLSLFVIGFAVAAAGNINPFLIAGKLWQDDAFREAMVKAASEAGANYGRTEQPSETSPPDRADATPDDPAPGEPASAPAPGAAASAGTTPRRDLVKPGQGRDCTALDIQPEAQELCHRLNDIGALQSAGLPIGWKLPEVVLPQVLADGCNNGRLCNWSWERLANWAAMVLGWLLTAVACSIGAPFWFDLLSRLVKIRGSGARSAEGAAPPQANRA